MSQASRSLISNDSSESSEIWSDYYKSSKDQKAFLAFIHSFEQKLGSDKGLSCLIPKDLRKKLASSVSDLFLTLAQSNRISQELISDNFSLLYVYAYSLTKEGTEVKNSKKKKDIINVIKTILQKFNDALITDVVDSHTFRRFFCVFFKILTIFAVRSDEKVKEMVCSTVCSIMDCAISNLHPIYYEFFVEDEDVSKINTGSVISADVEKDLLYLAMRCLKRAFPHENCDAFRTIFSVFQYISTLLERPSTSERLYFLTIEKAVMAFEMLNVIQEKKGKNTQKAIHSIETNIQFIVNWVCEKYLEINKELLEHSQTSPFGVFFDSMFKLFSKIVISVSIESVPIQLFDNLISHLVRKDALSISKANTLQLQAYLLMFLSGLYKTIGIKTLDDQRGTSEKQVSIIRFLLRKEIFLIDFGDNSLLNLADTAQINWRTVWMYLSMNKNNIRPMTEMIISMILENNKDFSYVMRMITWIPQLEKDLSSFLKDSIKEGLVTKFCIALKNSISIIEPSSLELLFKFLAQLLSLNSIKDVENINFIQYLDNKQLLFNDSLNFPCLGVIKKLLLLNSNINNKHFKEIIKKNHPNQTLVNFLKILFEVFELNTDTQGSFLQMGILVVLHNKINPDYIKDQKNLIELWEIIIKCARILLLSNKTSTKHMDEFDFNTLAEYLSYDFYEPYSKHIALKCIEDIELILYKSKSLTESQRIAFPQAVPLMFQLLTYNFKEPTFEAARKRIELQLHKEIEIPYLAHYNAFDVILKYFSGSSLEVADFFKRIISKIIPFHITPQALSKLLNIIKNTKNSLKKITLLEALEQAIPISDRLSNMLTPTNYFYFNSESSLQFRTENYDSSSQSKLSILTWIRPNSLKDSTLFQLITNKTIQFTVMILNKRLAVQINNDSYQYSKPLEDNVWSFICITVRSKKSSLWKKSFLTICINRDFEEIPLKTDKFECKMFNYLICGNGVEQIRGYEGKMSAIVIAYKSFTDAECNEYYRISQQYSLNLSINSLKSEEFKMFKELKKSMIFEWQPNLKEPTWIFKGKTEGSARRFNGVSIFESIKAIGGLKALLPLINIENQVQAEIILVTSIILKIFLCTQSAVFLTQEFIQFAGYVLICVKLFPNLTSNLIKIVTSLENESLRMRLLKLLLQNESIDEIQISEKVAHLNGLMGYIKGVMECDRENLYVIYRHIYNLQLNDIERAFENFVPNQLNEKHQIAICYVLLQMNKEKSSNALEAMLNVISKRADNLIVSKELEAGLIYLLTQPNSKSRQIVRILLRDIEKLSEKKNNEQADLEKCSKLIVFLNKHLDKIIDHGTIQSIFQILCTDDLPQDLKTQLLDIITNRISYTKTNEDFLFYLTLIEQHISKLITFIYRSETFPDWLCNTVNEKQQRSDLFSLCNLLFFPQEENIPFEKLKRFIRSTNSNDFKIRLLKKLCEDYKSAKILIRPAAFLGFTLTIDELPDEMFNEPEVYETILNLVDFGRSYNLVCLTKGLDSSFTRNYQNIVPESIILRLTLSIIYKGLRSSNSYIEILRSILVHNKYFTTDADKTKTEQRVSIEDEIVIEIFVNICEAFYKNPDTWLDEYIPNTFVLKRILNFFRSISETKIKEELKDIDNFAKRSFSNVVNASIDTISHANSEIISRRTSSSDWTSIKEELERTINQSEIYPKHLRSPEWINKVHCFLFKYFIINKSDTKGKESWTSETFNNPHDYSGKIKAFLEKFDTDWIKSFKDTRELTKNHIAKKYKAYLRSLKRLKVVLAGERQVKYKIRPYFDNKNRYSLTRPCKADSSSLKNRAPINRSPEKLFMKSLTTRPYFDSFNERSGEMSSPVLEENEEFDEETQFIELDEPETQADLLQNSKIIECERITIKGSYFGSLEINGNHLVYTSEVAKARPEGKYPFSSLEFTHLKKECKRIWESSEINEIISRRFIHQRSALEIFLKSGKSYYFNVFTVEAQKDLFALLRKWKNVTIISDPSKIVKRYTKLWTEGKLDNFGYILALNKLASRSFHDISQYPVFPWVLTDYTSDKLDINNPSIYRDFNWPVGAQSEERREELARNFQIFQEDGMTAFNYGSHYSSGGIVLHYLVRLEPFSHQARLLQNGSYDVPDRLFFSMENAWKSCSSNNGDVKELVPELFYFTDILLNTNMNDFGFRQNGEPVGDFIPPSWAKNNWDFVRKHRRCLESAYVTEELNNWIDLVFGYKQFGVQAQKNLNVFFSVSYEEEFVKAYNENTEKKGIIEHAYHFGQVPINLFTKPHIQKKSEKISKISIFEKFFNKSKQEKREKEERMSLKPAGNDQEVRVAVKVEELGRIFALVSTLNYLLAVKWDTKTSKYFLLKIKWESPIEFGQKYESIELDGFCIFSADNWLEYQSWKSTLPKIDIKMILDIGQYQFCVWEDKYLVSAFHTDNTFKINSLGKGELKKSIKHHCGLVTCVFSTQSSLFSGSLDSSIVAWRGEDLLLEPVAIYLGHNSSIRQIQASDNYQVVISLSSSGLILLHDMRSAECLRKLADPDSKPARVLALSEMGIIAVAFMDKEYTGIFSFNGMKWDDSRPGAEDVWCMAFDKAGEYLVTGSNKSIAFFDVFDNGNGLENLMYQSIDNTVLAVCISKDEEFLVFANNNNSKTAISLLKIQSKSETMNTLKVIQQFA